MQPAEYSNTIGAAINSEVDARRWFAVRVKSHRERITAHALRGQGYESFLPLCRPSQTSGGHLRSDEAPLFPGYIFARFDKDKRLPILMLPSVVHIVGIGTVPMPIDNGEIASIRTIVSSPIRSQSCPYLTLGERVSIVSGPLTGAGGIIVALKNGWRLVVSITLLQRSISVEIDPRWVERCVQPHTRSHFSATRNALRTSPERVRLREV